MANAVYIYRGKAKTNSWARWMVSRTMKQNKNNLIAVIGKTGSGKSYSAISICEIMSKMDGVPFTIEHIVFSFREFMELLNRLKDKSRGVKIVFDEPQVSIDARNFQSEANKVFNYVVTTFRHRNLSVFFCAPFETLLDKSTRKLFHARFETMSINKNNQTCRLKPRFIEYSDFKPEPYRKRMIICFKDEGGNNKSRQLFYWDVPHPSKEIAEQYETKRKQFTDRLNKNITERVKKFDESGNSLTAKQVEDIIIRKLLTPTQERVMKVLANIKESNRYERASKKLGVSLSTIHKNKTLAEKKGYNLEEFKQNND